jgi:hypothetical protein
MIHIIYRYLRFVDSSCLGDATSSIGACLLLAMKSRGSFKIKLLKKIVQSAYCQIYVREEAQVGKSSDTFIERSVEKEDTILSMLRHDVYVSDITSLIHTAVTTINLSNAKNIENKTDINKDIKIDPKILLKNELKNEKEKDREIEKNKRRKEKEIRHSKKKSSSSRIKDEEDMNVVIDIQPSTKDLLSQLRSLTSLTLPAAPIPPANVQPPTTPGPAHLSTDVEVHANYHYIYQFYLLMPI